METAVWLGLMIALCWGCADIQSSLVRLSAMKMSVFAQGCGMLTLVIFGMATFQYSTSEHSSSLMTFSIMSSAGLGVFLGLGAVSAISYFCMYRAFQSTDVPTGVVSTVISGNSAMTVLLSVGILHEQNLGDLTFIGIILSGVLLVAYHAEQETQRSTHVASRIALPSGLIWALAAAMSLGFFNFGVGLIARTADWYWVLFGIRALSLLFLALLLTMRTDQHAQTETWTGRDLFLAAGSGILEVAGVLILSIAVRKMSAIGTLSAIASCSVVLPLLYSFVIKREPLQFPQLIGVALMLLGLISLSGRIAFAVICMSASVLYSLLLLHLLFKEDKSPRLAFATMATYTQTLTRPASLSTSIYWEREPPLRQYPNGSSPRLSQNQEQAQHITPNHSDHPESPRSPIAPARQFRRSSKRVIAASSIIAVLLITSALLFSVLVQSVTLSTMPQFTPSTMQIGTLAFTSSGQLDPTGTSGINDMVTIDLRGIPSPAVQKSYYAWLLPDPSSDEEKPLLLGKLFLQGGSTHLFYTHPQHKNLLAIYSGIQVTEQEDSIQPLTPSLDPATWRYQGHLPTIPRPGDARQLSYLDHLRHLLAKEPTIASNGLAGGLDIWLYRNSSKILEWVSAARDNWAGGQSPDLIHRDMIRVLDYLDGANYVWRDVPPGSAFLTDPQAGHIGLLNMDPNQDPPGYLSQVNIHFHGLIDSPGHPKDQEKLALQMDDALNKAATSLQKIHQDAVRLGHMSNDQLKQPDALTILNNMVTNTTNAVVGQTNLATGNTSGGIIWIHAQMQHLAVIPVNISSSRCT